MEELINTPFEFGDEDTYDPDEEDIEPLELGKEAAKVEDLLRKILNPIILIVRMFSI